MNRIVETLTPPNPFDVVALLRESDYGDAHISRVVEASLDEASRGLPTPPSKADADEFRQAQRARVRIGLDELERRAEGLDRLLMGRPGGFSDLETAFMAISGATESDFNAVPELFIRATLGQQNLVPASRESVGTSSWPVMLGSAIHRAVVAEYAAAPGWNMWRALVSSTRFNLPYKPEFTVRLGGYGVLPGVNEGAPFQPLPTPNEDSASSYTPSKRGGTEDITEEILANRDISAVKVILEKLGRSAANTITRYVVSFIDSNATVYDGSALFAAGHVNTFANPLTTSAVLAAMRSMRRQAVPGDPTDVIGAVPAILLVAPDLEGVALELCSPASTLRNLTPLVVPWWGTGTSSATQWYLLADPATVPTIEVGFVGPDDQPDVIVQPAYEQLGHRLTVKIRHSYAAAVLDYRGMSRGNS